MPLMKPHQIATQGYGHHAIFQEISKGEKFTAKLFFTISIGINGQVDPGKNEHDSKKHVHSCFFRIMKR